MFIMLSRIGRLATAATVLLGLTALIQGVTPIATATSYHTVALTGKCTDFSSNESFIGNTNTREYITWDANYLYLGWNGGDSALHDRRVAAFDLDPPTYDGSNISYSGVSFGVHGQPDYIVEVNNTNGHYTLYWTSRTTTGGKTTLHTVANPTGASNWFNANGCPGSKAGSAFTEVKLSRTLFTGGSIGGLGTAHRLGVYMYYYAPPSNGGGNWVYGAMPFSAKSGPANPADGAAPKLFTAEEYFRTTDGGRAPDTYGYSITLH
ncbi:MAG TPA: hypothetical protein VFB34_01530 [Chloroflexota bacterium]|nr:hypothetical protein [Chloroflexota bacterium]